MVITVLPSGGLAFGRLAGAALSTEADACAGGETSKIHFRPPDAKPLVMPRYFFLFIKNIS
jgi:hypothetical protein